MFKNLLLYRIAPDWSTTLADVDAALAKTPFAPCGASQPQSSGWVSPRGEAHGALAESIDGQWLLRLQTERKLVPASVVRERVEALAVKIEQDTGRKPGKKAQRDLKDQVLHELLPVAFTKRAAVGVWIAPAERLLAIDAGRQALADELLTMLVQALPGFAAQAINTALSPASAMADWLSEGQAPANFGIDRDCELKAPEGDKPAVRYARHTLDIDEVREHITAGKRPTRLALTWSGRVSFTLTDGLQIKKLAFLDGVFENRAVEKGESFDADAAIATGELAPLIGELLDALGGEEALGAAPATPVAGQAAAGTSAPVSRSRRTSDEAGDKAPAPGSERPPWEAATAK